MADTMELKDFVSQSLKDIIQAVHDVQNDEDVKNTGAKINPRKIAVIPSSGADPVFKTNEDRTSDYVDTIDFDIAVTAESGKSSAGGISVLSGIVGAGIKGKSDTSEGVASRLKFSIPIVLPIDRAKELDAKEPGPGVHVPLTII